MSLNSKFTVALNDIVCFSVQFCKNLLSALKCFFRPVLERKSSTVGCIRQQLGNTSTCPYGAFAHAMQQIHHQIQDALDVGLPTQALVRKVRFDVQQSHHQLQDALDDGFTTQALAHKVRIDI